MLEILSRRSGRNRGATRLSIFSIPIVADTLARAMNRLAYGNLDPRLKFDEIPRNAREVSVPTRHGDVRCIVYAPPSGDSRPGVYVNFHGGGFVFRDPEQDDPLCRYLAANAGVFVVNVDYGVAPKSRFPVPVEQAFDVVRWASDASRDWDGTRLCVGGQSAGGNLTAAVARLSRDHGGPPIALQVIHYAPLDLSKARKGRPRRRRHRIVPPWLGTVFQTAYVPDAAQRRDPLVSPIWGSNAENLEGLAPALVITAEHDNLREDGFAYARALGRAGALVEHVDVAGAGHAYNIIGGTREQAERTYALIATHVRQAVAGRRAAG